jgi:NAD(P)-dependent dehydrogenase (short-subunit alcohol dehydrogenase family)
MMITLLLLLLPGLARSAAATYAAHNIRVNCVAPGMTRTPQTK